MAHQILPYLYQGSLVDVSSTDPTWHDTYDALVWLAGNPVELPPKGSIYLHWMIDDGPIPSEHLLFPVAEFAARLIGQSKAVLIACGAGINRSGLVCALTVMRREPKLTGVEAVQKVMGVNPNALRNPTFVEYLNQLHPNSEEG